MKKIFNLALTIFLAQLLISCGNFNNDKEENLSLESDFDEVKINNEYKIMIPDYMSETTSLNDEASLQFQNIFKEAYIIVIDESKEEFISIFKELDSYNSDSSAVKNYRDVQLQSLHQGINITKQSAPESTKIGGLDAEVVEIEGNVTGVNYKIYYYITFLEGKEKMYMAMAWTLDDRKKKYKPTFKQAVQSFRLLKEQGIVRGTNL